MIGVFFSFYICIFFSSFFVISMYSSFSFLFSLEIFSEKNNIYIYIYILKPPLNAEAKDFPTSHVPKMIFLQVITSIVLVIIIFFFNKKKMYW
jgi:hypothetical protein